MPTRRRFLQSSALMASVSSLRGQDGRRPNILFAIFDDWGYGHAGAYGADWVRTPSFDRVAREGVLFTNCFTSNPKCSPCRATILTGRNSWQTREAVSHHSIFPNEFPVYPSVLEGTGYATGLTGKGWGPGDFKSTGWKHNPAGPSFDTRRAKPPYTGISNNDYAANFADFLARKPNGKPFCFWLGGSEPHRAYEEGSGVRAGRDPKAVTLPSYWPDNMTVRSDVLDYALEVEHFDAHIGRAMKLLEDAGELDNTLLVVTSDHGMPFPRIKGQIYDAGFRIPLAVRWGKNIPAGRKVDDFINTRDFGPTFLEAAGVKQPATMTGRSFIDILKSPKPGWIDQSRVVMLVGKERHDLGRPGDAGYPVRAIRTPRFLYVRNYYPDRWPAGNPETGYRNVDDSPTKSAILSGFDGHYKLNFGRRPAEELYDIQADPDCVNNLATNRDYALRMRELRTQMERMLTEEGDPRMLGREDFFDTIQYTGQRKHAYDTWLRNQ
ncbi:MAG: heparan N-sulfatase [Candidatus Solibacter sp.]|nr:heparan N-sulfatase [Candidatus Solibacter sp.]